MIAAAPPIVGLHGFAGSPVDFGPFAEMLRQAEYPGSIRGLALPGHPGVDVPADFDAAVDGLASRFSADEVGRVHVVGYSLGARLALGLLVRHPALVARATLIGVHPGLADEDARAARRKEDERWARLLEEQGVGPFLDQWEAQRIFDAQRRLPEELQTAYRTRRLRLDPRPLAAAMRVLSLGSMHDRTPQLPSIRCPVLVVAGEHDDKFRHVAARMAKALPHGKAEIVPHCGHNVLLERPAALASMAYHAAKSTTT